MSFDPRYIDAVLQPVFNLQRDRFAEAMLQIRLAHLLMLREQGILAPAEVAPLLAAGLQLWENPRQLTYDPECEDYFFVMERWLGERVGAEAAGNLHVAMSRNDLDAAQYRMLLRDDLLAWLEAQLLLRQALLDQAARHHETLMPAHTHHQQAQPTTLAHYLLAAEAPLARDAERLRQLYQRMNRSPLGAAALAGTGFPIDREAVARRLGFQGLVDNTYDAVGASDHMVEAAGLLATHLTTLTRLVTDLLFWCENEVASLHLGPGFIQRSSIMPQKRNPVALEHIRAMAGRALGEVQGVVHLAHNVPWGDVNDVGDQMQEPLAAGLQLARTATALLGALLGDATFDAEALSARVRRSFAPATELADWLVRERGLPFQRAHRAVSQLVDHLQREGLDLSQATPALLAEASGETELQLDLETLREVLDPWHFVSVRNLPGGPAPEAVKVAAEGARIRLGRDRAWLEERRVLLNTAKAGLLDAARA